MHEKKKVTEEDEINVPLTLSVFRDKAVTVDGEALTKWDTHQQSFSFGKIDSPCEAGTAPVLVGSVALGGTIAEKQHRVLVLLQMYPVQQSKMMLNRLCLGLIDWLIDGFKSSPANHNDYLRTEWKTRQNIHTLLYTLF